MKYLLSRMRNEGNILCVVIATQVGCYDKTLNRELYRERSITKIKFDLLREFLSGFVALLFLLDRVLRGFVVVGCRVEKNAADRGGDGE